MNKPLKYFLILFASLILFFLISFFAVSAVIYTKGLSLDPFSEYISKQIPNYNEGSSISYNKAILKYDQKNGFFLEADRLIYFDSVTQNTFEINFLFIDFDLLSLAYKKSRNIHIDLENIRVFNKNSVEIAKGTFFSSKIENENSIELNIDEVEYLDDFFNVNIDSLSADIRNKKDILMNIKKTRYENKDQDILLFLDNSLFRMNIDSLLTERKSNFYLKSEIKFENKNSYNIETEFHQDEDRLIIHEFIGNDIYLSEQGIINFSDGFKELSVKLNFRAKAGAFNHLLGHLSDLNIKSSIDGFVGWQNFYLDAILNLNKEGYEIYDNSKLLLSGIYDFRKIELPDLTYDQLRDSTIYDIAIVKRKDAYEFKVNNLKNDFIQLNTGSELVISDTFDNASVKLVTSFKKDLILDYIKGGLSQREANNNKFYDFMNRNLYANQDMILSFDLEPNSSNIVSSIKNINIYSEGKFDSNYIFDDNRNPNYIIGIIGYQLSIENLNSKSTSVKGRLDLGNTEAFIRQINLKKKKSQKLNLEFSGNFKILENSIFNFQSYDSDYNLDGEVIVSNTNHIFVNDFRISNNENVDLIISGDLSERILNLDINGPLIDLSQNKVEVNKKKKEYYLDTENYKIQTDNVIFNGGVRVNNFKAGIVKKKSNLSVYSSAEFDSHKLSYSREKNDQTDTNIIISDDITQFVGDNHAAKKLLSDGSIELNSIRNIENLEAEVSIKLDDFVLINTPVSLKLLSLPSISGLVSIAEGEPGVRFGYGEINYIETEKFFSNIDAFAVSDSLGLVMDGSIDRKKKIIDMKGEISPMHLVNAIIQKLPIIGNILVGNEGEGMFSIDFNLSGNSDDPEVDSVPLSIIKPRILERAVELIESGN